MQMKLRTVLLVYSTLIIAVIGSLAMALVMMTNVINRDARTLSTTAESIQVSQELKGNLLLINREALLEEIDHDERHRVMRQTLRSSLVDHLEESEKYAETEEERQLVNEIRGDIFDFLGTYQRPDLSRPLDLLWYRSNARKIDLTIVKIDQLIEVNRSQAADAMKSADRQNSWANTLAFGLVSFAILVVGVVLLATRYLIYQPMMILKSLISDYDLGQRQTRAEETGGIELVESREIADTFNSMADRLDEKQQSQLQFIASVAHDIRNPINSMSMASEILLESHDVEEREMAQIIRRQLKNLDRIVTDLMDTARIEAGKLELSVSKIELTSILRDSIELYRLGAPLHRFELSGTEHAISLDGDSTRLSQVFNNLISNAIKYSPNGGLISVKVAAENDEVRISICDQGIGIAEKDIARVFTPFQRTKETKRTIAGTGLGLSVSRRIVEAHRGTLTVESRVGLGSCFTVTLPAKAAIRHEVHELSPVPSV
jgi:signal transduction histidine kinase